ncbi:MAG: hypothetical protein M3179_00960 [Actinomycetota bacterium]|nr:hypothetical protein [Actinomycetota bacterium]
MLRSIVALLLVAATVTAVQFTEESLAQTSSTSPLTMSVANATALEGPPGATADAVFTVALNAPAPQTVSVKAVTANVTATAGSDYAALTPTTVTFGFGESSRVLRVRVSGDAVAEGDETFAVNLYSPVGAVLADTQGVATILDEEGAPTVSISDVSVAEGAVGTTTSATFTVSLSAPAPRTLRVKAATGDGTALAGSDYTSVPMTTLTFATGDTTKTVTVPVTGDGLAEGEETFVVNLFAPEGMVVADGQGLGFLGDGGLLPALLPAMSIGDVTVVEGGPGATANAVFTVSLAAPAPLLVTAAMSTADGSAAAGSDYAALGLPTTVGFGPGEVTKTIAVPVVGDAVAEGNERFVLNLALPVGAVLKDGQAVATVLDEEGPPAVSLGDVRVGEGPAGTTGSATLTASLSAPAERPVTVSAVSSGGTAIAGLDYTALALTPMTFAPGQTTATLTLPITGDGAFEPDETVLVHLIFPNGAVVADGQAVVTIAGDRLSWAPPALSSPTTVTVNSDIIRGRGENGHKWFLDSTKDYEIRIGTVNTSYGVVISGGRNVVIKGGYITIPWAGTYSDNAAAYKDMAKRRALLVANQTGTVHIEGLLIDNALGDLTEGIQIQSPNADVQIENVRITGVHARDEVSYTDNHPDCVQPLGVKALRVDRFTCSTDAQAFYLDNGDGALGRVDIRRTNVSGTVNTYPYLFHRVQRDQTYPLTLSDVWVKPQPGDSLFGSVSNVLMKGGAYQGKYTASVSRNLTASWPDDPTVTGLIRSGTPAGGDFVPAASVGLNYVSPGYL